MELLRSLYGSTAFYSSFVPRPLLAPGLHCAPAPQILAVLCWHIFGNLLLDGARTQCICAVIYLIYGFKFCNIPTLQPHRPAHKTGRSEMHKGEASTLIGKKKKNQSRAGMERYGICRFMHLVDLQHRAVPLHTNASNHIAACSEASL